MLLLCSPWHEDHFFPPLFPTPCFVASPFFRGKQDLLNNEIDNSHFSRQEAKPSNMPAESSQRVWCDTVLVTSPTATNKVIFYYLYLYCLYSDALRRASEAGMSTGMPEQVLRRIIHCYGTGAWKRTICSSCESTLLRENTFPLPSFQGWHMPWAWSLQVNLTACKPVSSSFLQRSAGRFTNYARLNLKISPDTIFLCCGRQR